MPHQVSAEARSDGLHASGFVFRFARQRNARSVMTMLLHNLTGAGIEKQLSFVCLLLREVEYVGERSRDRVERFRNPRQTSVVLDERENRTLIGDRMIDVVLFRER